MIFLEIPRRLALVFALQIMTCVYVVLGVGAVIKARQLGDSDIYLPMSGFSLWIKAHGWLLMTLPIAWYWFHVRSWIKSGSDMAFLAKVLVSGLAVLALLFVLAVAASAGVLRTHVLHYVPLQ